MKAMILAAGRGERLRPLTDVTPKPLLEVAGKALIEYHLEKLAAVGFREVIINTAWLAEKLHRRLGDGSRYHLHLVYADEGEALETAGGIYHALPLLGNNPFLVVNGDIWSDFDFASIEPLEPGLQANLILVSNPPHHSQGDFAIENDRLSNRQTGRYTYSGIGVYSPAFFSACKPGKAALAPLLREKADKQLISAQLYSGYWTDIGTFERLQALENRLRKAAE